MDSVYSDDMDSTSAYFKNLVINPILYIMSAITDGLLWKSIVSTLLYFVSYYIYNDVEALMVLLGFIVIDWITGIWKVIKLEPKKFSSARFRDTAIKGLFYVVLIAMTYSLHKVSTIFDTIELDTWMLTYLCLTELVSVMENITKISGIIFPTNLISTIKKLQNRDK